MNLLPPLRKTLVFLHKNAHLISAAMKKFYTLWLNAMVVKKVVFFTAIKKAKKLTYSWQNWLSDENIVWMSVVVKRSVKNWNWSANTSSRWLSQNSWESICIVMHVLLSLQLPFSKYNQKQKSKNWLTVLKSPFCHSTQIYVKLQLIFRLEQEKKIWFPYNDNCPLL